MNEKPVEPTRQAPVSDPATKPAATAPAPAPKKSNTGLIALLIGLGVVGLLAIIGLIIYFTTFYVSKSDYDHALTQTNTVIDKYNKASTAADSYTSAVTDSLSSEDEVAKKAADYKTAYNDYKASVKTLESTRAMKNGKVKAAYDQFVSKNNTFTSYEESMTPSMDTLRKITLKCSESSVGDMDTSDLDKLTSSYDAAVTPCIDALKELSGSKNADAAKLAKDDLDYYAKLRVHIVAMQAAHSANDRNKFEDEYNAFMDVANDTSTIDKDITSIQKHQDSLSPDKELNNLASVINAQ